MKRSGVFALAYAFDTSKKMSTERFENFYFDACRMDYGRMNDAMEGLVER